MVAGAVIYYTDTVAHSQYTAAQRPAASALIAIALRPYHRQSACGVRYFDFGTSNEDGGRVLNEGLIRQKASFGAGPWLILLISSKYHEKITDPASDTYIRRSLGRCP